ncbi:MAG: hypothetical protein ACLQBB_12345 [Solirubrobacteraceae bacterium]
MSRPDPRALRRRRRRLLAGTAALLAAAGLALASGFSGHGVQRAAGLSGAPELVAQTDDSLPVKEVTLFGASPDEASGEVWGISQQRGSAVLVRYSPEGGWTLAPEPQSAGGEPLSGFQLDTPEAYVRKNPSPLAAQMTPDGAAAMLGDVGSGAGTRQVVLVRNPGQPFKEVTVPSGAEGLEPGESLFGLNRPPLLAPLEEGGGQAGAFVVPIGAAGVDGAVLHWNGTSWTRETIEVPASAGSQFEVLAISAASTSDAWLLARLSGSNGPLALFRRHGGATPSWQPVALKPGGEAGEPIELDGEAFEETSGNQAQVLTATGSGVWVDGRLHSSHASLTLYFAPEGEAPAGSFTGVWCRVPASSSGVPPALTSTCEAHPLPEPLPTDYSRSFAWAGSGYGERIVTGLPDGQMLRLGAGGSFNAVNSLGGQAGAEFGAAFASSTDGWLGKALLPVHVTTPGNLAPNRLQPWPVPFRYALTALAPEPGAPVGEESSEVLAVGDNGEVARYHPGEGWFPETLPGPGGKRATPRLRAVAWPTPQRAFAVGDSIKGAGQMWKWRGETGLWEKDPAMPLNFRGNLLGIAFDPNESTRGYAVGQQGVLLSYGKSWTQEPEEALPPAARGANFTSIAFAGSEAIVAWRKLVQLGRDEYTSGIIVNNGSGWQEDAGAAAVLGATATAWAVAALPDGGAAFTARERSGGALVYERNGPGAPWQPVNYPGGEPPGGLALFREGSALRAIGTGSEPPTIVAEEESPPPPGFPPNLVNPYPLASNPYRGVLRQTATGWSDQEHELNDAREPPGGYAFWDTPDIPDPVSALLVDPSGAHGWAVGGVVNNDRPLLDTSDIYRYPAEGKAPPGVGERVEKTTPGYTPVAVGGGAACAAPCATRGDTGIGPQVWLTDAVGEAAKIGVGAFVYTGPGVTDGALAGPPLIPVPWQAEERYYDQRASGLDPLVCVAPSPSDREGTGQGSEAFFEEAFLNEDAIKTTGACRDGGPSHGNSYSFQDGPLRVIVLDTSLVSAGQREPTAGEAGWVTEQLAAAAGHAIVVGNADLPREFAEGHGGARELVQAIEGGHAAAYLFDAPEQNIQETLTGAAGSTKAYGSGTLGYVNVTGEESPGGFIGQSGFLLVEVADTPSSPEPVRVKLVPNIGELAMEAQQGTLLQRSQAASFAGLARRPRSGNRAHNQSTDLETAPYIQIPDNCLGSNCARGIVPEYEFHSSNTEYGEFVERDIHSAQENAVEHDAKGRRISQEREGGKDGLFCALNATPPGHPVDVTLRVANLVYSLPVTIQAGSVRQPCGTTPLAKKPVTAEVATPTPVPAENPPPSSAAPTSFNVAPPAVPAPTAAPHVAHHTPPPQFLPQAAAVAFVPAFVPVPLPTPARPTPPSGTSAVTSPVEAAQEEEEEEAAPESVDAASAYRAGEYELPPQYLIGLIVLAAFAGASLRRRRPRRGERIAPATVNASRSQRRWEREDPGRWR